MTGAEVEKYYRDGHIRGIAEYCESDVLKDSRPRKLVPEPHPIGVRYASSIS
jgi:hypothetical protein